MDDSSSDEEESVRKFLGSYGLMIDKSDYDEAASHLRNSNPEITDAVIEQSLRMLGQNQSLSNLLGQDQALFQQAVVEQLENMTQESLNSMMMQLRQGSTQGVDPNVFQQSLQLLGPSLALHQHAIAQQLSTANHNQARENIQERLLNAYLPGNKEYGVQFY